MTTTYSDGDAIYTLKATGPVFFGSFSVTIPRTSVSFGYTESDIDAAVSALVDSLNASGHYQIDSGTKIFAATGTSDWSYTP